MQKASLLLEGEPKKLTLASYGDFRQYLYEAPVMSMPVYLANGNEGIIKVILAF